MILLTDAGETKEDLRLPEDDASSDLVKEIKGYIEADKETYVTVQSAMN